MFVYRIYSHELKTKVCENSACKDERENNIKDKSHDIYPPITDLTVIITITLTFLCFNPAAIETSCSPTGCIYITDTKCGIKTIYSLTSYV